MAIPPYASPLAAVAAIGAAFSATHADRFARRFEEAVRVLDGSPTWEVGSQQLVDLTVELRRHLRALGRHDLLPRPEGRFHTPTFPRGGRGCPTGRRGSPPSKPPAEWLSTDQIRRRLRVRREVVLEAMDAGRLKFDQRGRCRYARCGDVDAWAATRLTGDAAAAAIHPDLLQLT